MIVANAADVPSEVWDCDEIPCLPNRNVDLPQHRRGPVELLRDLVLMARISFKLFFSFYGRYLLAHSKLTCWLYDHKLVVTTLGSPNY
jgi:hypothetical protein